MKKTLSELIGQFDSITKELAKSMDMDYMAKADEESEEEPAESEEAPVEPEMAPELPEPAMSEEAPAESEPAMSEEEGLDFASMLSDMSEEDFEEMMESMKIEHDRRLASKTDGSADAEEAPAESEEKPEDDMTKAYGEMCKSIQKTNDLVAALAEKNDKLESELKTLKARPAFKPMIKSVPADRQPEMLAKSEVMEFLLKSDVSKDLARNGRGSAFTNLVQRASAQEGSMRDVYALAEQLGIKLPTK